MRTQEYQHYFDVNGPRFAAEQAASRHQRVAVTSQPVGELSLAAATIEQPLPAAQPELPEAG